MFEECGGRIRPAKRRAHERPSGEATERRAIKPAVSRSPFITVCLEAGRVIRLPPTPVGNRIIGLSTDFGPAISIRLSRFFLFHVVSHRALTWTPHTTHDRPDNCLERVSATVRSTHYLRSKSLIDSAAVSKPSSLWRSTRTMAGPWNSCAARLLTIRETATSPCPIR